MLQFIIIKISVLGDKKCKLFIFGKPQKIIVCNLIHLGKPKRLITICFYQKLL